LLDRYGSAENPFTVKGKARQPKTAICLLMEVNDRRLPVDRINYRITEGTIDMTRLEYFKARLDATMTPVDLLRRIKGAPSSIGVVDVRNGPPQILVDRIPGALQIPQSTILARIERLPRDRTLVLYCWDTWCGLAAEAAVPLLERGFDVKEMYGGINAWKTLKFPTEPVAAGDLVGQVEPLPA
jgi:rhodanese-related sulfurtransferase